MKRVISISFGELALKGANRKYFEDKLIHRIRKIVKRYNNTKVYKERSKIYVEVDESNIKNIAEKLKKVFGIVHISPAYRIEKNMESIEQASVIVVEKELEKTNTNTFKVKVKRADKKFPMNSMEVAKEIGAVILKEVGDLSVDLHTPQLSLYIDIRDNVYIYTEKISAYGGLPTGTSGRGLLLLSGGIDSPVAGFMIGKRGVTINAVHYHSYPFTSQRAEDKVINLGKILSDYCGSFKIFSVNILEIQKQINEKCPEDELTIIVRRFMMRIAEEIAKQKNIDCLITGESLGQVASQTMQGLNVTNSSVSIPILRPLIGMNKNQITKISKDIGTYKTSILPYDDCCTVFLPKHPVTRPLLKDIEQSESVLDIEKLIDNAISNMRTIDIDL